MGAARAGLLEYQADQQLTQLVQVGWLVELGSDRQYALALLALPGLANVAAHHDSHLIGVGINGSEEGVLCRGVGLSGLVGSARAEGVHR